MHMHAWTWKPSEGHPQGADSFPSNLIFWGKMGPISTLENKKLWKTKNLRATRPVPVSVACRHGSHPSEASWTKQSPKTRGRNLRRIHLKFKPKTQHGIFCFKKTPGSIWLFRESFWNKCGKPWRQRGTTFSAMLGVFFQGRDYHLLLATCLLNCFSGEQGRVISSASFFSYQRSSKRIANSFQCRHWGLFQGPWKTCNFKCIAFGLSNEIFLQKAPK